MWKLRPRASKTRSRAEEIAEAGLAGWAGPRTAAASACQHWDCAVPKTAPQGTCLQRTHHHFLSKCVHGPPEVRGWTKPLPLIGPSRVAGVLGDGQRGLVSHRRGFSRGSCPADQGTRSTSQTPCSPEANARVPSAPFAISSHGSELRQEDLTNLPPSSAQLKTASTLQAPRGHHSPQPAPNKIDPSTGE